MELETDISTCIPTLALSKSGNGYDLSHSKAPRAMSWQTYIKLYKEPMKICAAGCATPIDYLGLKIKSSYHGTYNHRQPNWMVELGYRSYSANRVDITSGVDI